MAKLTFHGGAQDVTGSNYLLETKGGRFLVDCGLFQGTKSFEKNNWEPFPYDVKTIDALFVTHGHLDHVGRIPRLVKSGFKGKIFSTYPTRDFAELMLIDSMGVLAKEIKDADLDLLYDENDVAKAMDLWNPVEYDKEFSVGDIKITFRDAGHILGSAMIEIIADGKKIVFSGDLGNPPTPLLREIHPIKEADYLLVESTYGNKLHEDKEGRKLKLERVVENTIKMGGTLMIPAFSIERTQELLFELNDLVEHGRIPRVPVFLDSPLAIKATEVYKKYEEYFNKSAKYVINSGDDVFKFPGLKFSLTSEESKAINDIPPPKIIIAGSGMSNGGRIVHHEKRYLPDKNSTLLLVCYQAAGSLGRILKEGASTVTIHGDTVPVNARIEKIESYSAHPDKEGLFDFVDGISGLKKVFVVQGEPKSVLHFVQRIKDYLGIDALGPKIGDVFDLN